MKVNNNWKQSLVTESSVPFTDIVSLRDLMDGVQLRHSVLSGMQPLAEAAVVDSRYNPTFYTEDTIPFECDFKGVLKRLKFPPFVESDFYHGQEGIKLYGKEAALYLSDTESFSQKNTIALIQEDAKFKEHYSKVEVAYGAVQLPPTSDLFDKLFKAYWHFDGDVALVEDGYIQPDGEIIEPLIAEMLSHTWICVLAYAYADLIDWKDFGQSLSSSSDVVHHSLILSGKGDHRRFDLNSDDASDDAQKTRPYIPTTTPLVDDSTTADEIYRHAADFGSLQTESLEKREDGALFTSAFSGDQPFWFDPASRAQPSDYIDAPITVPKDGNLLLDGRIFSRTIDELWESIKRIQFGIGEASKLLKGTGSDTRPLPARQFAMKDGSIGDPLHVTYENLPDGRLSYSVDSYVKDPDEILYSFLDEIEHLAKTDHPDATDADKILALVPEVQRSLPEERAFSLRELEALIRVLQFNLAYLAAYSERNFVRMGALHQLHHEGKPFTGTVEELGKSEAQSVFLSAAGTWQSVPQTVRVEIRTDEEF